MRIATVTAPRKVPKTNIEGPRAQAFFRQCRGAHDCCGHQFSQTHRITRARRRDWVVEVRLHYIV
mgnify:CR=1 FL=1